MSCGVAAVIAVMWIAIVTAVVIGLCEQIQSDAVVTHHRFGMSVPSERQPAKKRAEQEEVDQNSFHDGL